MHLDAHQHFWRYTAAEYGWIDEPMAALRRDFLPSDLAPLRARCGVDATIAVQARTSLAETRWLCELARTDPSIAGVVGWVDLTAADCAAQLAAVADDALCGIRHVLQAESPEFASRPEFQRGIALLADRGLAYDLLVKPPQWPAAVALCRRFPAQTFVLDHCGKPDLGGDLGPWRRLLADLAPLTNVCCKVSGLVTEADWQRWTPASLQPWFDAALAAFTPDRLLFGSDWPVCLVAASYERWHATVAGWLQSLAPAERAAIAGGTAARVYRRSNAAAP